MDFFKHAVVTGWTMPGADFAIRLAVTDVEYGEFIAHWVLLQLSLEADLTRGCFT